MLGCCTLKQPYCNAYGICTMWRPSSVPSSTQGGLWTSYGRCIAVSSTMQRPLPRYVDLQLPLMQVARNRYMKDDNGTGIWKACWMYSSNCMCPDCSVLLTLQWWHPFKKNHVHRRDLNPRGWGGSVSVVSNYRLDDHSQIPRRGKDFSSRLCIETGSGAQSVFYPMGISCPFLRAEEWHWPLTPSSDEVKNE